LPFRFTYTNEADSVAYRTEYPPYTSTQICPEAQPVPGFVVRAKLRDLLYGRDVVFARLEAEAREKATYPAALQ
jgi:hypothetical protein